MMTGPNHETEEVENAETRPISVAELLAKNGNIGAPPVTGRRRRRRGNSDAVTVAELTGEIPVITDDDGDDADGQNVDGQNIDATGGDTTGGDTTESAADPPVQADGSNGSERADDADAAVNWLNSAPRFPKSPPQQPDSEPGPKRSSYPGPVRPADQIAAEEHERTRREQQSIAADTADTADAADAADDTDAADAGSGRLSLRRILFGERVGPARRDDTGDGDRIDRHDRDETRDTATDDTAAADEAPQPRPRAPVGARLGQGSMVVLESVLAVVLGAGLFVAFDQLWQWNNIVALVLAVLVTLGLVAAVQVVRKTVDTTSTLIAVAVGLLITLGPLALLRSV